MMMKKNKATSKLHCIALPVALLTLSTSLVQASSILDSMDRLRRASYGTPDYAERDLDEQKRFAPYSPADSDLGDQLILRPYSKRVPVYARISTGLFFTDNVATTATGELDGVIWKSSAEVNWTPRIGNNLFAKFSLSQDIYRHDRLNQIDFEHTYMHAGLVKIVPDFYDTLFFTRLEYSRITRGSISNSAYASSRFRVGAHKVFLSTPRHTAYVALDAAWDINTTPSVLARNEYNAHTGYTYRFNDKLRGSVFYHLTNFDYTNNRNDVNHIYGGELEYLLTNNASLTASLTRVNNDSNLASGAADYNATLGGLSLGYKMKF